MMHNPSGVLPDTMLHALVRSGAIIPDQPLAPLQIQPCSLDLRLSSIAYRIRASFLPGAETVDVALQKVLQQTVQIDDHDGLIIPPGSIYLVPLQERLKLPPGLQARANPKSSTGRLDIFVRVICDRTPAFDTVPDEYEGRLYLEIAPKTFPIRIRKGTTLSQIRFFRNVSSLDRNGIARAIDAGEIRTSAPPVFSDTLALGINLMSEAGKVVGWRARQHTDIIDLAQIGTYNPIDFFEPVLASVKHSIILDPDAFYIFGSSTRIGVGRTLCAEALPFDASIGEVRNHYAGFIDSCFGIPDLSRLVFEVRARDVPFYLEHGQPIGMIKFEPMARPPHTGYGDSGQSNYQGQGLRLSKQFASPERYGIACAA